MLRTQPGTIYIVYPSWASFTYGWDQLPQLMSDPLGSGYLDKGKDYEGYGFRMQIQPFEMLSSRAGNGIVVAHTEGARWLPEAILGKEAGILAPDHIDRMMGRFDRKSTTSTRERRTNASGHSSPAETVSVYVRYRIS